MWLCCDVKCRGRPVYLASDLSFAVGETEKKGEEAASKQFRLSLG